MRATSIPIVWRRGAAWPVLLLVVGCTATAPVVVSTEPLPHSPAPAALAAPLPVAEGPLTLDALLDLAARNSPDLAAARARADVARGKLVQAGIYPNPIFTPRVDELGQVANPGGKPGLTMAQEIVTAHKLQIAQAAAAQGVAAADWQAVTRWFDVTTRVRLAYYELLTARREYEASEEVLRLADDGLRANERLEEAKIALRPDVLRARVEREQSAVRLSVSRRRLETAGRLLAAAVGLSEGALPTPLTVVGTLEEAPPDFDWQSLVASVLARSSEVQEALALALQAEQLLNRALADRKPNVTLTVRPFYSYPDRDTEVLLEVGTPLPVWNRNQGNILAARADVDRTRAEARAIELRLTERLAASFQRYQAARRQAEAYAKQILPDARESLRLVRVAYDRGDPKYDYTAVLQAQQTLAQAQLANVQALGELWRAVAEIGGLLQNGAAGPAPTLPARTDP